MSYKSYLKRAQRRVLESLETPAHYGMMRTAAKHLAVPMRRTQQQMERMTADLPTQVGYDFALESQQQYTEALGGMTEQAMDRTMQMRREGQQQVEQIGMELARIREEEKRAKSSWIQPVASLAGAAIGTIIAPGAGTMLGASLGSALGGVTQSTQTGDWSTAIAGVQEGILGVASASYDSQTKAQLTEFSSALMAADAKGILDKNMLDRLTMMMLAGDMSTATSILKSLAEEQ